MLVNEKIFSSRGIPLSANSAAELLQGVCHPIKHRTGILSSMEREAAKVGYKGDERSFHVP